MGPKGAAFRGMKLSRSRAGGDHASPAADPRGQPAITCRGYNTGSTRLTPIAIDSCDQISEMSCDSIGLVKSVYQK